jgi:hypothetical protein
MREGAAVDDADAERNVGIKRIVIVGGAAAPIGSEVSSDVS